jgi:hypothetical protein
MKYDLTATIKDGFGRTQTFAHYSNISVWKAFWVFIDIYFKTKKNKRNHIIITLDEKLIRSKNE